MFARISIVVSLLASIGGCSSDGPDSEKKNSPRPNSPEIAKSGTVTVEKPAGRVAELVTALKGRDDRAAFKAAAELATMGPKARAAIPALVERATIEDQGPPYAGLEAVKAIPKIDRVAAVPHLAKALSEPSRRYFAAFILKEFGADAEPAVPALVAALRAIPEVKTADERMGCTQCAIALGLIQPAGLRALINEMRNDHASIAAASIWATPAGPAGTPAVNQLTVCLGHSEPKIRSVTAVALSRIGPSAESAIVHLQQAMQNEKDNSARASMRTAIRAISKSD